MRLAENNDKNGVFKPSNHLKKKIKITFSIEENYVMLRLVVEQEQAFNSIRQRTEQYTLNKVIIAENGPLLHQADTYNS